MTQLKTRPIKNLYQYAFIEGEGVGTAYEYFAKRLVLASWLPLLPRRPKVRILGLPEKYGVSLDFWLLADELGAELGVGVGGADALVVVRADLPRARAGPVRSVTAPVSRHPGWILSGFARAQPTDCSVLPQRRQSSASRIEWARRHLTVGPSRHGGGAGSQIRGRLC